VGYVFKVGLRRPPQPFFDFTHQRFRLGGDKLPLLYGVTPNGEKGLESPLFPPSWFATLLFPFLDLKSVEIRRPKLPLSD